MPQLIVYWKTLAFEWFLIRADCFECCWDIIKQFYTTQTTIFSQFSYFLFVTTNCCNEKKCPKIIQFCFLKKDARTQKGNWGGTLLNQFCAKSFSFCACSGDKSKVAGELHLGARWQTSLDCDEVRQFAENDAWIIGAEWQLMSWIMHRMDNSAAHCIEGVSNTCS